MIEALIEQLHSYRREKLALVALVGSMNSSEQEALTRLREIIDSIEPYLDEKRSENKGRLDASARLAQDVLGIARDIEPWLAQSVERKP